jgi:FkbM family methyltransferase
MTQMKKNILEFAARMSRLLPMPVKRAVYRFQPLARLVRRTLNRAAPLGLTQVKVAAGGLAGVEVYLDLQTEKDYWLGTYEPELQQAVMDWIDPGMVAYDVGANIGYISLLLAHRVGANGRVFSFEALPANLDRLSANLALAGMDKCVQVVPAAIIEAERPVRFWIGPSGGMGKAEGSAGRQDVTYPEAIDVNGISLDSFVYERGNPPPQVVKMDIEGGEVLALPGMRRLLEEAHPLLLMELHGPEAARTVWQVLTQAEYRICQMQPGYPVILSLEALDWKAYIVAMQEDRQHES